MKKLLIWVAVMAVVWTATFLSSKTVQLQAACLLWSPSCAESVDVEVTIIPGDVCIGYTGSFDFGTYTSSAEAQTVSGSFTDDLWVEDLKGADTGYYTTLQLSGDLVSPDGNTIPAANVSVQSDGVVTVIGWSANPRVVIDGTMTAWFQTLDSARTFIEREDAANSGLVGKYGNSPDLQVVIPAYTPVGTYTATLVYTLYEENDWTYPNWGN